MSKKSEALSLPELIKKRNKLMLQLKLGKSKDTGGLAKIRREIARMKTTGGDKRPASPAGRQATSDKR